MSIKSHNYQTDLKMAGVSKLDYLKKYLSKEDKKSTTKGTKKKKKTKGTVNNLKIIDYELSISDVMKSRAENEQEESEDEKPLVFAEDGVTIINRLKEEEEAEREKKWAPAAFESITKSSAPVSSLGQSSAWSAPEDSDGSDDVPSKKTRRRHDSPDAADGRGSSNISPDLSPVRKRRRDSPDSDLSPSRRQATTASSKQRLKDTSKDLSPPRRKPSKQSLDQEDLSPPRANSLSSSKRTIKIEKQGKYQDHRSKRKIQEPELITEKKGGIQSLKDLKRENELRRKEAEEKLSSLDSAVSGKNASTVYRDKTGRVRNLKQEKIEKRKEEEKRAEEDEKFMQWGKGVKQTDDYQKKLEDDLYEMSKPLARYKDDADLDASLKSQAREGDPMLAFLSKKTALSKGKKELPKYKGPAPPPNRFNIWPGYRWDGVDRSNGFEKKRFEAMAEKQASAKDAYKWSVEDM